MQPIPTPASRHHSGAARCARRCSSEHQPDPSAFMDMDPAGFSLSDLAFEMEEDTSSDAVFHTDGCAQRSDGPSTHRASDSLPPPPLAVPPPLANASPCCYTPSTSRESPADVTDDAWIIGVPRSSETAPPPRTAIGP